MFFYFISMLLLGSFIHPYRNVDLEKKRFTHVQNVDVTGWNLQTLYTEKVLERTGFWSPKADLE